MSGESEGILEGGDAPEEVWPDQPLLTLGRPRFEAYNDAFDIGCLYWTDKKRGDGSPDCCVNSARWRACLPEDRRAMVCNTHKEHLEKHWGIDPNAPPRLG